VLKFRSNKTIVIAPAKTGRDNSNKIAVSRTDQVNRVLKLWLKNLIFILKIVLIKLTAPKIEEIPAI
jgi:hypothetical protein